jgi:hypothetical protein
MPGSKGTHEEKKVKTLIFEDCNEANNVVADHAVSW